MASSGQKTMAKRIISKRKCSSIIIKTFLGNIYWKEKESMREKEWDRELESKQKRIKKVNFCLDNLMKKYFNNHTISHKQDKAEIEK